MKTLYLHGLASAGLTADKKEVLEKYDLDLIAPKIDYRHTTLSYFKELVETNKPDLLIGSSMGGRMCYWLSNIYSIPAILFNPALGVKICDEILPIDNFYHEKRIGEQLFIFGEKDTLVPMDDVLELLEFDVTFLIIEDMGHKVSPENIDFAVFHFLNEIKE